MSEILKLLAGANALHRKRHFVYTSTEHGEDYANLRVMRLPEYRTQLETISLRVVEKVIGAAQLHTRRRIALVGPDTLGAIIAEVGAMQYRRWNDVDIVNLRLVARTSDQQGKTFSFETSHAEQMLADAQVVYIDDLMNESSTWRRCRGVIEQFAPVTAIGVIIDRSGKTAADLEVPHFVSLEQVQMERYPEADCILCANHRPIVTNLGHGQKFKEQHPDYAGGFTEI